MYNYSTLGPLKTREAFGPMWSSAPTTGANRWQCRRAGVHSRRKRPPCVKGAVSRTGRLGDCPAPHLTIPPSRLAPCHPQAPFVCFADIFPANGEIYPLHKGGFRTVEAPPYIDDDTSVQTEVGMSVGLYKICNSLLTSASIGSILKTSYERMLIYNYNHRRRAYAQEDIHH